MQIEQHITLDLAESECRDLIIELGELEGIASSVPGGLNTETGLVTLHRLRDLLEAHGLGVRQRQLETEVAYLRGLVPAGVSAAQPQYPSA